VPGEWLVDERVATPAELHTSWPAAERDPGVKRLAVCRPTRTAVVLGSTQSLDVVDTEVAQTAGIDVVRRRSGGGAVLVTPDDPVWVDVWLPIGDERWSADVTGAFAWVGAAWGAALGRLGLDGVEVQGSGPGACTRWSSLVCFGGVGAGEVSVGGRKAVGLAQRRNRSGAWFHTACVRHWNPTLLLELLELSPGERAAASEGLSGAVTGVADEAAAEVAASGGDVPTGVDMVAAFLDSLA
jgi:lipoate-protein ligase A